jgi:hypothetical protein
MIDRPTHEAWQRQHDKIRAQAIATFPYERIETTGELALATWQELRPEGRSSPVVLGGDEEVAHLMGCASLERAWRGAEGILAAAAGMRHPEGLVARRAEEDARARERMNEYRKSAEGLANMLMLAEPRPPPVGRVAERG